MNFSFVPQYAFFEITDISPDYLKGIGVRFLMLDLDNTIAAYGEQTLSADISHWAAEMKADGIELFIISNSTRKGRVESFAKALGVRFIKGANKPSSKALRTALTATGFSANESALVGDQILTDTLAANRAGVTSIVLRPRSAKNPILAIRYAMEVPFRVMCKNKMQKGNDSRKGLEYEI